jgi:hypothetical protein
MGQKGLPACPVRWARVRMFALVAVAPAKRAARNAPAAEALLQEG